ncbi:MAG: inorganic phosphate transporter [Spirochaetes bacterium]|nr:inorganic phosphate transporter [Spirochaetota bacterium]
MELYLAAVILLILLAISDLIVGVSNDAVNFLNSSLGSRVAPRYVIMAVSSLGILAGVTFSSGMMEVARKGIFHPALFQMDEIMVIFMAVMITDILLLDVFNTFGLPTSTTVSIVFELLGGAVAVSMIKVGNSGGSVSEIGNYINTGKALIIISGILLSVAIAFFFGTLVQFITRLIFTFDYQRRLKRYGGIWGGISLSIILYFMLIKGAKGASFISADMLSWIESHTAFILLMAFIASAIILQTVLLFTSYNILKPIVLIGTFALAMSFAANDLVNFIGVPLAGLSAYQIASVSDSPLSMTMEALQRPVQTNTLILLGAGAIMTITLWLSKKARTVSKTEISLGRQVDGIERFESSPLSRSIVRLTNSIFMGLMKAFPNKFKDAVSRRLDPDLCCTVEHKPSETPSFDLLRASVNLMVASALISFATSLKLPLSTTYVTFMVSMGSSLADRAWGRESAAYRVAGVLTVIGGWFITALMAFTVSLIFAYAIYYFSVIATVALLGGALFIILLNHRSHKKRIIEDKELNVFNLDKVTDAQSAKKAIFIHCAHMLQEVRTTLNRCYEGLFSNDLAALRDLKKSNSKIQNWANIITANIYKTLRLLNREHISHSQNYAQIINTLQEIAESHRDILMRSLNHVDNHHKGMLEVQIRELKSVIRCFNDLLDHAITAFLSGKEIDDPAIEAILEKMDQLSERYDRNQISRIVNESSKTRLSILFYGIMGKTKKIAIHIGELVEIFKKCFTL